MPYYAALQVCYRLCHWEGKRKVRGLKPRSATSHLHHPLSPVPFLFQNTGSYLVVQAHKHIMSI